MLKTIKAYREGLSTLQEIGTSGFAIALGIQSTIPQTFVATYAHNWVLQYHSENYAFIDPTVHWCAANQGHTRWSDMNMSQSSSDFMEQAAQHGLRFGVSFSYINKRDNALKSRCAMGLARDDRELTPEEIKLTNKIFTDICAEYYFKSPLSDTKQRILALKLAGHTTTHIAGQLGSRPDTIKEHLCAIRVKLGAQSTEEAIQIAKIRNIIS